MHMKAHCRTPSLRLIGGFPSPPLLVLGSPFSSLKKANRLELKPRAWSNSCLTVDVRASTSCGDSRIAFQLGYEREPPYLSYSRANVCVARDGPVELVLLLTVSGVGHGGRLDACIVYAH